MWRSKGDSDIAIRTLELASAKHKQLMLFVLVGGWAALVNFGSRIILNRWMSFSYAIVVAYVIGMLTAFVLNRILVFQAPKNKLHHQVFWFVIVNVAAVLQTLAVSLILVDVVFPRLSFSWHTEVIAHALGVMVPVFTSFIGHKMLTFKGA